VVHTTAAVDGKSARPVSLKHESEAVNQSRTDPEGAHSSTKTPFSLGELLPISFNAPVSHHF
jgi:hypothetical protein